MKAVTEKGVRRFMLASELDPSERIYTVTVLNDTREILDWIAILYRRTDRYSRIVPLFEWTILPGEYRIFHLCICKDLDSYILAAFSEDNIVARIPPDGGIMTSQMARNLGAANKEGFADAWVIETH